VEGFAMLFDIRQWRASRGLPERINNRTSSETLLRFCGVTLPSGLQLPGNHVNRVRIKPGSEMRVNGKVAVFDRLDDDLFDEHAH
jgi:hypothetical protein